MTARLTEADLAAIEARANAAPEGPWELTYCGERGFMIERGPVVILQRGPLAKEGAAEALGRFVTLSRTDVPALIADLRNAWAALKTIETVISEATHHSQRGSFPIAAQKIRDTARAALPTEGTKP